MKHKFLKDLGLNLTNETEELLKKFNINEVLEKESDNREKEEEDDDSKK